MNNTTVWSDPRSGSHIEFSSFAHLARTAERAKFDFLFLAEGLRLREQNGQIYDLDVVGRPDTFTVLAALAAVTDRLGLAGTINSTFNEPYEVARQFASLDHLSGGRAAWNVVTSWDAFTGENFRRGGFLPQDARYERARTFLQTTWELFDSWRGGEIVADKESGVFLADAGAGRFTHHDSHFDISGQFSVPRSPQGRPVIFQAGDSEEGREFAASSADAIFTRHGTLDGGQAFYADVKGRLGRYGRPRDELLILPAATFVLGDTDADARELARQVRFQQVSGQTAIMFAEQLWNRDLSGYDPDGPLPDIDPDPGENTIARGRASVRMYRDPLAVAAQWRARAEAGNLSIRELIIEVTGRQTFVGAPATVAKAIDTLVQADASDGFILVPHITPGGLDDFADRVVPLLQERGVFRSDYQGSTLREHLGLAPLSGAARRAGRLAGRPRRSAGRRREPRPARRARPGADQLRVHRRPRAAQQHRPGPGRGELRLRPVLVRRAPPQPRRGRDLTGRRPGPHGDRDRHDPDRVRRGPDGPPHRAVDGGGVRPDRRAAPGPPRPRPGPVGRPPEAGPPGRAPPDGPAAPHGPGAALAGNRRAPNGLLIPPKFSSEHLLGSPRFALQKTLLQLPGAQSPDYTEQVSDVLALLRGTYRSAEGADAHVIPGEGADLQVWILGSSGGESARVAGANGLRFAANYHVSPATVLEAADGYRAAFRPSGDLDRPYVSVSADVVVAGDGASARELAAGYGAWVRSIRSGEGAIPYPAPAEARAYRWSDTDRAMVADRVDTQFAGSAKQVADQLEQLQEATGADELIITTITHDHADRVRSYRLLAEEWGRR